MIRIRDADIFFFASDVIRSRIRWRQALRRAAENRAFAGFYSINRRVDDCDFIISRLMRFTSEEYGFQARVEILALASVLVQFSLNLGLT